MRSGCQLIVEREALRLRAARLGINLVDVRRQSLLILRNARRFHGPDVHDRGCVSERTVNVAAGRDTVQPSPMCRRRGDQHKQNGTNGTHHGLTQPLLAFAACVRQTGAAAPEAA